MNKRDLLWIIIRTLGLYMAFRAVFSVIGSVTTLLFLWGDAPRTISASTLVAAVIYGVLGYYLLFKGEGLHRIMSRPEPG